MRIGLSYDLKEAVTLGVAQPEDALEEYDSRETVETIEAVIGSKGHEVVRLGGGSEFLGRVIEEKVDFVFNIAEGRGNYRSREAQVPSVLEMLGVPYSGSDPQCLAICLDKVLTKKLVAAEGVCTPKGAAVARVQDLQGIGWDSFPFPAFVKPAYDGSSKGVRLASHVERPDQARELITNLLVAYRQPILIEEFIAGDEVTVGVLGNSPPSVLGIMRVLPRERNSRFVYSLEVKRDWEKLVDYECPARLGRDTLEKLAAASLKAFQVLGCRDFGRIDFRISPDGTPYFLEINPLAGLNPHSSDLPIMARMLGLTYEALIAAIFDAALARYPQCT